MWFHPFEKKNDVVCLYGSARDLLSFEMTQRNFRGRFREAEKFLNFVEASRNQQATQIGEAVEQDSHVHAMELSFLSVCIKYHCLVGDL